MADKEVTDLTAASALALANSFHLVQSGNSREATMQQILDLIASSAGLPILIEEYAGDGSTGTHTFSSIPGTYKRLRLEWDVRSSDAAATLNMTLQINGDTGANYDRQFDVGANATTSASATVGGTSAIIATVVGAGAPASVSASGHILLPEYVATTFQKTGQGLHAVKSANAAANLSVRNAALWWRSTAAITSLTVALSAGNYVTGSIIRLYGEN